MTAWLQSIHPAVAEVPPCPPPASRPIRCLPLPYLLLSLHGLYGTLLSLAICIHPYNTSTNHSMLLRYPSAPGPSDPSAPLLLSRGRSHASPSHARRWVHFPFLQPNQKWSPQPCPRCCGISVTALLMRTALLYTIYRLFLSVLCRPLSWLNYFSSESSYDFIENQSTGN